MRNMLPCHSQDEPVYFENVNPTREGTILYTVPCKTHRAPNSNKR